MYLDNEFLLQQNIPKIEQTEKESCKGLITIKECQSILNLIKINKSPGQDGLPVEFCM